VNTRGQIELFGEAPQEVWSYSRLKSLMRCPLEYKVRWVDRQQYRFQPGNIDVQAGRLLHQIVREYFRCALLQKPKLRLPDIYDRLAPTNADWKSDARGEDRVLNALGIFAHSGVAGLRPIALEVACKAWIGGQLFTGQADMIYEAADCRGVYGILEFKLNDVEVRAQDPAETFLQCIIYYLGMPLQYQSSLHLVGVYVFEGGTFLQTKIGEAEIKRAIHIVEGAVQRSKGPEFPPMLNPFCGSCGYQASCPAYSNSQRKEV